MQPADGYCMGITVRDPHPRRLAAWARQVIPFQVPKGTRHVRSD